MAANGTKRKSSSWVNRPIQMGLALADLDMPDGARLVAILLAAHSNEKGLAWPSRDRLAQMCKCSARSISRRILILERMGILRRQAYFHRKRVYQLDLGHSGVPSEGVDMGHSCVPSASTRDAQASTLNSENTTRDVSGLDIGRSSVPPLGTPRRPPKTKEDNIEEAREEDLPFGASASRAPFSKL